MPGLEKASKSNKAFQADQKSAIEMIGCSLMMVASDMLCARMMAAETLVYSSRRPEPHHESGWYYLLTVIVIYVKIHG